MAAAFQPRLVAPEGSLDFGCERVAAAFQPRLVAPGRSLDFGCERPGSAGWGISLRGTMLRLESRTHLGISLRGTMLRLESRTHLRRTH